MKDSVKTKICKSFEELKSKIDKYIIYYNNYRYKWDLKKMTPVQYRNHLFYIVLDIGLRLVEDVSLIETLYKPSINVTLNSATQIFKEKLLSVILTGMGNDGLVGCGNVKKNDGYVIVEAEESCIVYGMPKVVFEAGLADVQVGLPNIFEQIMLHL